MSRHFLCCIPVRVGVFIFTLLSSLSSALVAAVAWYILYEVNHGKDPAHFGSITGSKKTMDIVVGVVFTIVALFSLFGFIGVLSKNRRMVKAYSFLSVILFIVELAISGVFLFVIYSGRTLGGGSDCVEDDQRNQVCFTHLKTSQKIAATFSVVLNTLIQLYILVIIRRYIEQLETEDYVPSTFREYSMPVHVPYDDQRGLLSSTSAPVQASVPYRDNSAV